MKEPKPTCPLIDDVIKYIRHGDLNLDVSDVKIIIEMLEDIRLANSDIREWGHSSIDDLESEIENHEETILDLKSKITELEDYNSELKHEIKDLVDQIEHLERQIEE
jgi:predicted  nucleic acid-binding Zn-ribbon protein